MERSGRETNGGINAVDDDERRAMAATAASTLLLERALASYVVPASTSGISWPSILRPGVTRPSRLRSASAGTKLHRTWSASVAARRERSSGDRRGVRRIGQFYGDEGFSSAVDADAALDAFEADARSWARRGEGEADDNYDLAASVLMLPRAMMRSLLVEEEEQGRAKLLPPVAAVRCLHGCPSPPCPSSSRAVGDLLCLRPAGAIGQDAEVVVLRSSSATTTRRRKKRDEGDDDVDDGDSDDSAGSWLSDGATSSSDDDSEEEPDEEEEQNEEEERAGAPAPPPPPAACLQTLRLPGVGLPLSLACACAADDGNDDDGPAAFFAVAASHWLTFYSLGLQEPSYYGAAGRTWGLLPAVVGRRSSCPSTAAEATAAATTSTTSSPPAALAMALQAPERISAVALSSPSSHFADPPVRLAFATERGGGIFEALPFLSPSCPAPPSSCSARPSTTLRFQRPLPPNPGARPELFVPLASRLVAEGASEGGGKEIVGGRGGRYSHLRWFPGSSRPHSLLCAEARSLSLLDLRSPPRRARSAAATLPGGGLATALSCCEGRPSSSGGGGDESSNLFAVATDVGEVLLYDARRPASPVASWSLRGSGGGGSSPSGSEITTLSISFERRRRGGGGGGGSKACVLAVDSRGRATCCAFERSGRSSRLRPESGSGGRGVVVDGVDGEENARRRPNASSSTFSWRPLSAAETVTAPAREMLDITPPVSASSSPLSLPPLCGSAVVVGGDEASSSSSLLLLRCRGGTETSKGGALLIDSLSPSPSSLLYDAATVPASDSRAALDLPDSAAAAAAAAAAERRTKPQQQQQQRFRPAAPPYEATPVAELLTSALELWERQRRLRRRQDRGEEGDDEEEREEQEGWRAPSSSVVAPAPFSPLPLRPPAEQENSVRERFSARLRSLRAALASGDKTATARESTATEENGGEGTTATEEIGGEGTTATARQEQTLLLPSSSTATVMVERLLAAWPD